MDYQSPFGSNSRLGEPSINRRNRFNESDTRFLPKDVYLDSEGSRNKGSPFQDWRNHKKNSYFNRSFDSDQGNRYGFLNKQMRRMGVSSSSSILDYYHPSMIEDPWKRLREKFNEGQECCCSEEYLKVNKDSKEMELSSVKFET